MEKGKRPDFSFERKYSAGRLAIGVDEVGRGCLAGPLVVAAVVFPRYCYKQKGGLVLNCAGKLLTVNDSKKLSPAARRALALKIKEIAVWDVTEIGVGVINRWGIARATLKGMRKTIKDLLIKLTMNNEQCIKQGKIKEFFSEGNPNDSSYQPTNNTRNVFVLADFFTIPYLPKVGQKNQIGITKGDQTSVSIAAASIIAKDYRDRLMAKLGAKPRYKKFFWQENKGYGTKAHILAIKKYGLTKYHRKLFVRKIMISQHS